MRDNRTFILLRLQKIIDRLEGMVKNNNFPPNIERDVKNIITDLKIIISDISFLEY